MKSIQELIRRYPAAQNSQGPLLERGPGARLCSPLPNADAVPSALAGLILHQPLAAFAGSDLRGSATLHRRADELRVRVRANHPVDIHLNRCPPGDSGRGSLLLLTFSRSHAPTTALESRATFDLARPDDYEVLERGLMRQLTGSEMAALDPRSIHSFPATTVRSLTLPKLDTQLSAHRDMASPLLAGADGLEAPISDQAYFERRMREEIEAALRAQAAGIASRHVQIATLMALRLRGAPSAGGVPA